MAQTRTSYPALASGMCRALWFTRRVARRVMRYCTLVARVTCDPWLADCALPRAPLDEFILAHARATVLRDSVAVAGCSGCVLAEWARGLRIRAWYTVRWATTVQH